MPNLKSLEEAKKLMLQQDESIRNLLLGADKEANASVDKALAEATKLHGIAKQEKD
jgi:hypothetical protein